MADLGISIKLGIQGAQEVKQRIAELHDQFNRGEITTEQYTKELKKADSQLRTLSGTTNTAKRSFMALHPGIASMQRSMQALGRVFRTTLAVQNAMNLAQIAMQGTTSGVADAQKDYNQKVRELSITIDKFGKDSPEAADKMDEVRVAEQKLKEELAKDQSQAISNALTLGSSIGLITSSMVDLVTEAPKFKESFTMVRNAMAAGGAAGAVGTAGVAGAAVGGGIIKGIEDSLAVANIGDMIDKAFGGKGGFAKILEDQYMRVLKGEIPFQEQYLFLIKSFGESVSGAFKFIWDNVIMGFVKFWNGIATNANDAIKNITKGVEDFANSLISAAERAVNALMQANPLNMGRTVTLPRISITPPQIPLIKAATGFEGNVTKPTMFLAGEAGPERVSITPNGNNSTTTVQIIVQGSIWEKNRLMAEVDDYLNNSLMRRGFK